MQQVRKIFIGVLALIVIITAGIGTSKAMADPVTERTDVKITDFSMSHEDGSTDTTFRYNERFNVNMDWDASSYGNTLKEGDYFVVSLPDKFRFPNNTAATKFDLTAPDGNVIGHAVVSPDSGGGGTVKVTFTNYVENRYDIMGKMQLQATFTNVKHDQVNEFSVSVGTNVKTISVNIKGPV